MSGFTHGVQWSQDMIDFLRKGRENGVSYTELARSLSDRFGVTMHKTVVGNKARELKIERPLPSHMRSTMSGVHSKAEPRKVTPEMMRFRERFVISKNPTCSWHLCRESVIRGKPFCALHAEQYRRRV